MPEQIVFGTFRTVAGSVAQIDAAGGEVTVKDEESDRLPATTLAEVKPGDRVLVASTKGADPGKLNAIALVAGLESLAPPRAAGGRFGRGGESELPPELMDLGMSIP